MWIWYLFCEAAAEETPTRATTDKKAKEEVKTGNDDDINLKVVGQAVIVVQFKSKRQFYTT